MGKGDKVLASRHNSAVTSVNSARKKWNLGAINGNVSTNSIIDDASFNNLRNWLIEAKNKSGYTGAITSSAVTGGSSALVDQYEQMIADANKITSFCPCHGNCTGSCSGCRGCSGCTGCGSSTSNSCTGQSGGKGGY